MNRTDQPILAAWRETVCRQPSQAAVFGADGAVLRTFADVEKESATLTKTLPNGEGIALVALGNHPSLPATLLALWRADRTVVLAEPGASTGLAGITLRVVRGPSGEVVFSETGQPAQTLAADFLKLTSGTTGTPRAIRFSAAPRILAPWMKNVAVAS